MPDPKNIQIPKIKHDGQVAIATGRSRHETAWKNRTATWSKLVERFAKTTRTSESFAEYQKSSKRQQTETKDVGGFVGGSVKQGRRSNRTMITLDLDFIETTSEAVWTDITVAHDFACVVYSTHSHKPDEPRLRLILPLSRPVMGDEYQAISRKLAESIGIDRFDDTTYEPQRLMYWPSTAQDGEFYFRFQDGPWLDPDVILALYPDWTDVSFWPESSRQKARIVGQMQRQEDPLTKGGIVGAFCKTYSIEEAIETYLPDVYVPTGHEGRYTYAEGSTTGGVVVYEDKWTFSHHGTDPASGLLCNAFDLVRIHKFGARDDDAKPETPVNRLPSYLAMSEFAAKDGKVKELIGQERLAQAAEDFDLDLNQDKPADAAWMKKLQMNRKGELANTIDNVLIVLKNDPFLAEKFAFNAFSNRVEVTGKLPWNDQVNRFWTDSDDSGVRHYVESTYGITGANKIADAVTLAHLGSKYHPVREYLDSLEWDGVARIDTLLTDYLGAEDSDYTRFVMRKWLCGAVARVYQPGIKFDYMLVLTGPQGIYKSTFFRFLGKGWFSDSLQDVEGNQAVEKLMGSWIIEFGELQAFNRSETNALKRFITSQEDRTRLAYDRRVSHLPRQCVFAGTTNRKEFLKDDTGNRRYWPVEVKWEGRTKDVIRDLRKEVDQIWAEAVFMWKVAGEPLYPSPEQEELANRRRELHKEVNEKEGLILAYLDKLLPDGWDNYDLHQRVTYAQGMDVTAGVIIRDRVSVIEIWCECLGKNKADLKRADSLEIVGILNNLEGWVSFEKREYVGPYGRQKVFRRI